MANPPCVILTTRVSWNSSTLWREGDLQRQERRFSKSMTAIAVRFPDESVELDNVEERRVLTALEVIYEGGWFHGKLAFL
jgi:hypothetical protein